MGTLSSLSKPYAECWYSVSEWGLLIFGLLLLMGVWGELRGDKEPKTVRWSKKQLRMGEESSHVSASKPLPFFAKYKHSFAFFVVIGVLGESFSEAGIFEFGRQLQTISDNENAVLNVRAWQDEREVISQKIQLNKTKTELANAQTRLNESIAALKDATSPMDIGNEYTFFKALEPLAGTGVELRAAMDLNSQSTAGALATVFLSAKWSLLNQAIIGDIGEQGIVIGYDDPSGRKPAFLLLKALLDRDLPAQIFDDPFHTRILRVPTNSIIVAVMQRPDELNSQLILIRSKEEIDNEEQGEIEPEIGRLMTQKFIAGSKELANAQAKYNTLCKEYSDLMSDKTALEKKEIELYDRIDSQHSKGKRGLYISGASLGGGTLRNLVSAPSTNSDIEIHGFRSDIVPLQ